MNSEHKEAILSNLPKLLTLIHFDSLVPEIKLANVFTEPMLEDIYQYKTDYEKRFVFLRELLTRGPHAFSKFIESLRLSGHNEAIELLKQSLSNDTFAAEKINKFTQADISYTGGSQCEGDIKYQLSVHPATEIKHGSDMYKMTSRNRGLCLLINNRDFEDPTKIRYGTSVDATRLDTLFQGLGYTVYIRENLKAKTMKEKLISFSKQFEETSYDSCVVIILSHGTKGCVYGTDFESLAIIEIQAIFDNSNCPALQEKPKLFFIQACQGKDLDIGVARNPEESSDAVSLPPLSNGKISYDRLPTCTDMLVCLSTVEGYISIRHHTFGSWYCQQLVSVFSNEAHNTEIRKMLQHISSNMDKMISADGLKQSPEDIGCGWKKDLYFNPGIYLDERGVNMF